jgi:hypothetical protein
VPLSVSIGSTVAAPYHRLTLWQLVSAADAGLTRAKQARRIELGLETNPDDIPTVRSGRMLRAVPTASAARTASAAAVAASHAHQDTMPRLRRAPHGDALDHVSSG